MRIDRLSATIYQFDVAKDPPLTSAATEEAGAQPIGAATGIAATETKGPREFLAIGRRNLDEQELANPVAIRFLIAELERLDEYCVETKSIVTEYHTQRVVIATLQEAAKPNKRLEILSAICLSVGSVGIGAASKYITVQGAESTGYVLLVVSVLLVVAAILSKVRK
jgi:hypothetical protein